MVSNKAKELDTLRVILTALWEHDEAGRERLMYHVWKHVGFKPSLHDETIGKKANS
jgi:hypothetical protein